MRSPTEDDRALFEALMSTWGKISAATRHKGAEVRRAIIQQHNGTGAGPTLDEVGEWEHLRVLEDAEREKVEALIRSIFD